MPRRLVRHSEHDRVRSLGWFAVWWIENFVLIGRGGAMGQPVRLGDERAGFVVDCYAVDQSGGRLYDSAFLSRPKGADKSGLAAALCLLELLAPVRFDRWAVGGEEYTFLGKTYVYEPGEPIGRQVHNPFVRILATEEEQSGNTYESVLFNFTDDSAPLHQLVRAYGVNAGKTRVVVPKANGGGEVRPSSSGAASKDGGLETFTVFDETHVYNNPRLREMYSVVSRNAVKRRAEGAWFLETTTMYSPGEESVAEQTYELAQQIEEGRARNERLLFDHSWGDPGSLVKSGDESEEEYISRLSEAFREAYGDAIEWNPVEGLLNAVFDTRNSETSIRRYFFNAVVAAANAWVSPSEWAGCLVSSVRRRARVDGVNFRFVPPSAGDEITLGFDGGRSSDATALVACRVSDRYVFPLLVLEAPDSAEADGWQVDREAVDAAVAAAHERFNVVGFFADPPLWQDYVDKWSREFGDGYKVFGSAGKPVEWWTNRDTAMVKAVERVETAIRSGALLHGGDRVLSRHVLNARRWERRSGTVIGKERKGSRRKIDAAMAMVLAVEAAAQVSRLRGEVEELKPAYVPFSRSG